MTINKGDYITVENNEIAKMMGHRVMSGKVFLVTKSSYHIQCEQTGCIELIDKDDGTITKQ